MKELLKRHLVYFLSRHLHVGFRPSRSIVSQEIRADFRGEELVFQADFRTPLYETVNEILDYDCYQLARISFSDSAAVVIDIGANIGVSSIALSRLHSGRIYAVEPIKVNFETLQKNLAANHVANVECVQCALGASEGEMTMAVDPDQSVSSYMMRSEVARIPPGFRVERVATKSLGGFLSEIESPEIGLIKMDCEGAEYPLIEQLARVKHESVRAITMEVHDLDRQRNCGALRKQLMQLGYEIFYKPELLGRPTLHHLLALRR